ncbi:MAG: MFS transporter [Deltaproteobacteria bacterium]|nr:MFS transporter [Myxococcales bacterium]MDP3217678.1 MFS transporter [Deltaproteobacteria bacterium]
MEERASAVSRRATVWAMVLLGAMNLLNYIDRFVLPAIIESVRADIPMTDAQQGVALTAFIWVYMLASPVFGRLGDTRSRRHLLAFGVALWSLATAAAAFATTFAGLVAARAAVGVGEAAYATIAPALIGDYFPRAKRGRAMAAFYLAIPVGSALGYILGGRINHAAGWQTAFLAVGLPGLLLAAAALTLTEPPRGHFDDEPAAAPLPLLDTLRALARNREYVVTVAGTVAYTFALGGLAQWMPTYLIRVRHMDGAAANTVFGTLTVLSGLLGTFLGGWLGDLLRGRVRHPYLLLSGVSTLLAVPFAVLAFTLPGADQRWAAVFVAETLVFVCTGPANTILVDCVPAAMRTMGFAVSILVMHVLGDAISPAIIGLVSDRSSLQTAVMLVPLAFALGGAVWVIGSRRLAPPESP